MSRLPQDDTLTKLGDNYHYLIALDKCFELKTGEKLSLEEFGDLSIEATTETSQIEIKHSVNNKNLSSRSVEFWNTFKNWIKHYDSINHLRNLILHTTAKVPKDSIFLDWDQKSVDERYQVIYEEGFISKAKEESFRKLYDDVFNNFKVDRIKDVLRRTKIKSENLKIASYQKNIMDKHLKFLSSKNRKPALEALLGYIIIKPNNPPHKWVVTYEEFEGRLQLINSQYGKDLLVIPKCEEKISDCDQNLYYDYRFVNELKRLKLTRESKQINKAINAYWQVGQIVMKHYDGDILFTQCYEEYQEKLAERFEFYKDLDYEKCTLFSEDELNTVSKEFFSGVMRWDILNFNILQPPGIFFQQGLIHGLIDSEEKKFSWHMEDYYNES